MFSTTDLTARVAQTLSAANWLVEVEKAYDGIQLDLFVVPPGESPIVVECKAYKGLVGLRTVRAFASSVSYLREAKPSLGGWLVTTNGFTSNATQALQRYDLKGLTLRDLVQRVRGLDAVKGAAFRRSADPYQEQTSDWRERIEKAKCEHKRVFAIMPFTEEMLDVFILGIRWAASELGVAAERADDLEHNGEIIGEIRAAIREYDAIVGDTSGANANVCYEVGYAHALEKPTILICRNGHKLPFDLQGTNHLFYPNILSLREPLRQKLAVALDLAEPRSPATGPHG